MITTTAPLIDTAAPKQKIFMSNRHSQSAQRTLVLFYNLVAGIGFAMGVIQCLTGQVDLYALAAFFVMSFLTSCIGITVGFHRYFTHKSFVTSSRPLEYLFAIFGSMACQGPLTYWVATHRCHHQFSDRPNDPHSPTNSENSHFFQRFFHAHLGWLLAGKIVNTAIFAKDIMKRPVLIQVNNLYHLWTILGVVLPGLACFLFERTASSFFQGVLWGGFIRLFVSLHTAYAVNSLCHMIGTRDHQTNDESKNLGILALLSYGEAWHNNHHASPSSARFGQKPHQVDLGFYVICLLEGIGLIQKAHD